MLSDSELQTFFDKGYVRLQSSLDKETHDGIFESAENLFGTFRKGTNPRNNVLPMIPDLWRVLDDPGLRSNVESLLGPHYLLHPHRHCHTNFGNPGAPTPAMLQPFHKDGHAHKPKPRHREPWWLILFYFPQATPVERGPTAVLPGTHLLPHLAQAPVRQAPAIEVRQGLRVGAEFHVQQVDTLDGGGGHYALCHFDLGHGAMVNGTDLSRYAFKFVLMRTARPEPQAGPEIPADSAMNLHLWRWLGRQARPTFDPPSLAVWQRDLASDDPAVRVAAMYASACVDGPVTDVLLADLERHLPNNDADWVLDVADAANGLALLDDPQPVLDLLSADDPRLLLHGAYAAGQRGLRAAIPRLQALTTHADPFVQRHALSALGLIGPCGQADTTIECLAAVLAAAEDWDVRVFAVQALIRMGFAPSALPVLGEAARDADPYVSAFAIEQLCRFDCDAARALVLEPLKRHRYFTDARWADLPVYP